MIKFIFTTQLLEMFAVADKFTYTRYLTLEDDKRYEIIEGELFDKAPAPSLKHQAFSRNLQRLMMDFVYGKKLGHVFNARLICGWMNSMLYSRTLFL